MHCLSLGNKDGPVDNKQKIETDGTSWSGALQSELRMQRTRVHGVPASAVSGEREHMCFAVQCRVGLEVAAVIGLYEYC